MAAARWAPGRGLAPAALAARPLRRRSPRLTSPSRPAPASSHNRGLTSNPWAAMASDGDWERLRQELQHDFSAVRALRHRLRRLSGQRPPWKPTPPICGCCGPRARREGAPWRDLGPQRGAELGGHHWCGGTVLQGAPKLGPEARSARDVRTRRCQRVSALAAAPRAVQGAPRPLPPPVGSCRCTISFSPPPAQTAGPGRRAAPPRWAPARDRRGRGGPRRGRPAPLRRHPPSIKRTWRRSDTPLRWRRRGRER